ncbi:membrane-spanning 4-domains subfamily A member 15-like [Stegostoma tigrinum]|uniref:membrane-spanning 4-domains subfamily A member 15-like n=1 Tax=Stegostoma tigrinum TaxID=3053191 RepID=UPI00202B6367|nr:membrane-spanning 4-domains subfamily A member 15-like [Stegostoma tigrinum]
MSVPAVSPQTLTVTINPLTPAGTDLPPTPPPTAHLQKFLEGEPKALGVTQILNGLVQISFGIPLSVATDFHSKLLGSPFVIGIMFIVSGALSIAAEKDPNIKLLRACLTWNVVSGFLAAAGGIIYVTDILDILHCTGSYTQCTHARDFYIISYVTVAILLLFTLLQLTVCITVSAFVCKSTRCCSPYSSMPLMIHDGNMDDDS